jgi:TonB-dependent receptor-like protein/TonB-like protein
VTRRRAAVLAAAAALAVIACAAEIAAQPEPPAPAPPAPITAVRPKHVTEVPYPEGAHGDAKVVLVLAIGADGVVQSVTVQSGDEPFASAARRAALEWTFEPATRAGAPIAVRAPYEVSFVEEIVPVPDGPVAPSPAPPPSTAPEPERGPLEVSAEGQKLPPSVSSLRRAEVRQLPGAFGDPFRAIEILPGVTPIVSGLPFFYVRGAPPGNVGYFLDGVRVPYLFHAAAGPSVVHPAIVDKVDLYAGGYPARYGRYAGAIVAAETTEPRPEWHGEAVIRAVDAGALVEGCFDDGRGTVLLGGRYSYTAALFSLISPEITLDYRDYQARVTYDITDRDRISLFAFGAYDFLSSTEEDIETVLFGSEFYRVDARYDASFPGGGGLRAAVTWGFDRTRIADGRNTRDVLLGTRVHFDKPIADEVTVRGGIDVQHDIYTAEPRPYSDPDDPETKAFDALFPQRTDAAAAAWTDLVWKPTPHFEVTPGIRVDSYYSNGAKAVSADPRLAIAVEISDEIRILHALGVAHQPPSFIVPVPGLAVGSLNGGLQRSLQAASGVEVQLPFSITATLTFYDAVFMNMTDTLGVRPPGDDDTQIPRSLGSAKGIELYVRRSFTRQLGGFVSYTFSRTTRSIDGFKFPAAFDRSHVLHSALGYDLGHGWRVGTRFSIYSGAPLLSAPPGLPATFRPSDPPRDPVFYRLDFRVEKKWTIADVGWISFVVEMLNATLNTETINGSLIGPVTIPSIGVEGGF